MGRRHTQHGAAFVAVLAIIGLLVAVSVAAAKLRNAADTGARMESVRDELWQQASLIRDKLIACTINWPSGDNGTGYRPAYPAAATPAAVSGLACPGEPGQPNLWSASDGVLPPRPLNDFGVWAYTNDAASLRLTITAANSFTYTKAAMQSVARRLGADQASVSGSTLTIKLAN